MESGLEQRCVRITTGRSLRLRDAAGRTVTCHVGTVWITQEGDPRDVFLQAGERCTLDRPGTALICAVKGMEDIWRGNMDFAVVSLCEAGSGQPGGIRQVRCGI